MDQVLLSASSFIFRAGRTSGDRKKDNENIFRGRWRTWRNCLISFFSFVLKSVLVSLSYPASSTDTYSVAAIQRFVASSVFNSTRVSLHSWYSHFLELVIPAAFTLTAGLFGLLNGIGGIFLGMRKCYKGYNNVGALLERGEAYLSSIRDLVKQVAAFVHIGSVSMEAFCTIIQRCEEIKEEMDIISKNKLRCI